MVISNKKRYKKHFVITKKTGLNSETRKEDAPVTKLKSGLIKQFESLEVNSFQLIKTNMTSSSNHPSQNKTFILKPLAFFILKPLALK